MRSGKCLCRVTVGAPGQHSDGSLYALPGRDEVFLNGVFSPPDTRGQGNASLVLDALVNWAERRRLTIFTYAQPGDADGFSEERLEAWYKTRGFLRNPDPPTDDVRWLVRKPQ